MNAVLFPGLILLTYSLMRFSLQKDQSYTPQIISAQSKGIDAH